MPRSPLLLVTCALAFALAGCDRETAEPAQPQETAQDASGAADEDLNGEVDKSFAGQAAPGTEVSDPAGAKLTLAELKGKPVLVNLWATWCAPCVKEMPLLNGLAAEFGDGVRVITVSEDSKTELVEPFFEQHPLPNLSRWMDPSNELMIGFGAASLPLTVMYDADGKEVWRVAGGFDWSSAEARELIAEASKAA